MKKEERARGTKAYTRCQWQVCGQTVNIFKRGRGTQRVTHDANSQYLVNSEYFQSFMMPYDTAR